MSAARTIELTEYTPRKLEREEITPAIEEALWRNYRNQIKVESPSIQTGGKWKLTSQGWVGHIPLTPEFHLALRPKVQLKNLFGMLEYAYQLKSKSFRFLEGLIDCHSLEEFYSQLAYLLARRILTVDVRDSIAPMSQNWSASVCSRAAEYSAGYSKAMGCQT
jgi:5-methylcytosine-specific restriction enzyme subunit McrC